MKGFRQELRCSGNHREKQLWEVHLSSKCLVYADNTGTDSAVTIKTRKQPAVFYGELCCGGAMGSWKNLEKWFGVFPLQVAFCFENLSWILKKKRSAKLTVFGLSLAVVWFYGRIQSSELHFKMYCTWGINGSLASLISGLDIRTWDNSHLHHWLDFPHSHETLCTTAHLEKECKKPFISQALQIGTVPPTEHVRNQFKGLDNPQDMRNRKVELRIKLIKLKAAWIKRKMKYTRNTVKVITIRNFPLWFFNVKLKLITATWILKPAAVFCAQTGPLTFNQLKLYLYFNH